MSPQSRRVSRFSLLTQAVRNPPSSDTGSRHRPQGSTLASGSNPPSAEAKHVRFRAWRARLDVTEGASVFINPVIPDGALLERADPGPSGAALKVAAASTIAGQPQPQTSRRTETLQSLDTI